MEPTTADIRRFLTEAFSDEELTTFCFDYFRDVYEDFTAGMSKRDKVQRLIEHCDRRNTMPNLLAALRKERTTRYDAQFGVPAPVAEPSPELPLIKRDPRQIFISHAHEDAVFAHRLAADLQARGWCVWIAPDSIQPGEKWIDAIERGLDESGIFLLALTQAAVKSKWVRTETNAAIGLEHQDKVQFIPLDVQTCDPPTLWNACQRVPFGRRYEEGLQRLLGRLDPRPNLCLTS